MKTKLHHFSVVFLFLYLVFEANVKGQKVTPLDWITVNNETWPPVDQTKTSFYLAYAGTSAHPTFKLNANHLFTENEHSEKRILLSKPSLSFRYWTNIDTGLFRYKQPRSQNHRDLQLKQTFKWANARLENISPEEWAGLKYEYADDHFSLALKDIRVEVMEREKASKLPSNPIHAYKKDGQTSNIALDSTPKSIIAINSNVAKITVDKLTLTQNVLQFEMLAIPNGNGEIISTLINLTSSKKNDCGIKEMQNNKHFNLKEIASINCITTELGEASNKKNIINSFNLTLKKEKFKAFVIIPKQPSNIKLTVDDGVSLYGQTYKVSAKTNSNNFISVIDSQPGDENDEPQDMCYTLIQIDNELNSQKNPLVTFDLYLTYPQAASGLYLDKITTSRKHFCLNDYIGFRLLKNYQLTLSISAGSQTTKTLPQTPFHFLFAKSAAKTNLNLVAPKNYNTKVPFTSSWHYSNRAFNYRIEGPLKGTGGQTNFSACDLTGNCFPYTAKPMNNKNLFQYDLEPVYFNELAKSPFLRIKSDLGPVTDDMFRFGYDQNSDMHVLSATLKRFTALNNQFSNHSTSATSNLHTILMTDLKSTTYYDLHIPIGSIDLRVNHLFYKLEAASALNNVPTFALKKLTFNNTKTNVTSDFTSFYKFKLLNKKKNEDDMPEKTNMSSLDEVAISTADFFHYDSFEIDSTIEGYFTLSVSIAPKSNKEKTDVKMTFELKDATVMQSNSNDKLKLKNLPVEIKKDSPFLLNPVMTTRVSISSGAIRLKGGLSGQVKQQLPQLSIKFKFEKVDNAIIANDIQINRIVRSQGTVDSVDVSAHLKINTTDPKTAVFEENSDPNAPILVNGGFFEIIYELVLNSNDEVEVSLEHFKISKIVSATGTTFQGPIIGTIDPQIDGLASISCPYLFAKAKNNENITFCQLDLAYYQTSTTCSPNSGCSNIFSTPLPTSSNYLDGNFEKVSKNRYYPNQLTMKSKNIESQYLHVSLNRTAGNESHSDEADYCLQFSYASNSASNSALWVATDLKAAFSIDFPANQNSQQNHIICQSWFSQNFASIEELYFRFDNSLPANSLVNLDSNYIEILPVPKWGADVVSFELGITRVKEEVNPVDWSKLFLDVPIESKSNFKLDSYGQIEYSMANLQSLKANSSCRQISFKLRTRWIRSIGKLRDELYLTVVPSGDAFAKDFLTVSLTVSSSTDGPIYQLPNLNSASFANISEQPLQLNLSQSVNYYQLTFGFTVDLDKVTTEPSALLNLSSLSVNDACSARSLSLQSGHPCNGHGSCVTANYHTYSAACHCGPGFTGDACSVIDYCTALNNDTKQPNEKTCVGASKCISSLPLKTFLCQCLKANETWNAATGSCLKTTIEDCGENEVRQLNDNGSSACVCRSGFIRVKEPSAANNNNATCIAYDVCNEAHRKTRHESPVKPCADVNAECKKKEGKGDNDQYECICKAEFYNKFEIKSSKAQCLSEVCKNCEQQCNLDGATKKWSCACEKGYTLEEGTGKCTPGPTVDQSKCRSNQTTNDELPPAFLKQGSYCACPSGFKYNSTSKLCNVDQALARQFGCTKVELKTNVDHQPGCVCLEGQQFDANTRKCLPHCTEEKSKECDARGASCQVTSSLVQCQCANGLIPLAENAENLEKPTCVSKCQLLEKYSQYSAFKCVGQFQRCDSKEVVVDPAKLIDGKTFFVGNSTITSAPSKHCSCDFGFEKTTSGQCTVPTVPVKYIRDVPFEVPASITAEEERKAYASGTIRPAFINLISALFKSVVREQSTCQLDATNEVFCTAAISTKLGTKQIVAQLSSSCIYSNDNKTCNYYTEETSNENSYHMLTSFASLAAATGPKKMVNVLARDATKEIKVESIDYCASPDRCSSHPDSHCKTTIIKEGEEENSYFECLCEPTFFTASSNETLLTTKNGRSLHLQSCRQRDLCFEQPEAYGCADKSATCSLVVRHEKNGNYSAQTFCSCPAETGGIVLPGRNRLCKSSSACEGRCLNGGQCAVDVIDATKVLCHCADGFQGEKCEKKSSETVSINQTSSDGVSSGYRTATIVLSVFFSLCLIVLVFVAIKAFTNFNVVLYVSQLIRRDRQ